jgi:3'(2'), 5'-bisphosphate nucleotidase
VWFVDPIDGTKSYLAGGAAFCVMIGLAIRGEPVLGVLHLPATGRLFAAVRGHGAYVELEDSTDSQRLRCSALATLTEARTVETIDANPASSQRMHDLTGLPEGEPVRSVGIKLAMIAGGAGELYANPRPRCRSWDTCAPQVVLEEAGGRLTDALGRRLDYQRTSLKHDAGLLASNGHLHNKALERLAPLREALR